MRLPVFFILLIYSGLSFGVSSKNIELKSPDNNVLVDVCIADKIKYSVNYGSKVILLPSAISMRLKNRLIPGNYPKLKNSRKQLVNQVIYPEIRQKRAKINDIYNELELTFKGNCSLIFRAYNDGVAYRFKTAFDEDVTVYDEESAYRFSSNDTVYFAQVNCDAKPGQDCFHTSFEERYKFYLSVK